MPRLGFAGGQTSEDLVNDGLFFVPSSGLIADAVEDNLYDIDGEGVLYVDDDGLAVHRPKRTPRLAGRIRTGAPDG